MNFFFLGKQRFSTKIISIYFYALAFLIVFSTCSYAATYYVCGNGATCGSGWSTGSSGNSGTSKALPKATIAQGIAAMAGGDTLIIGNGTYVGERIANVPNGSAGAYTIVKAENVHGVTIDRSAITEAYADTVIKLDYGAYIQVEGINALGNIQYGTQGSEGIVIARYGAHHIKLIRISASGAGKNFWNTVLFTIRNSSNILMEECWGWGTGRYKVNIYQSTNVIVRRCVMRQDYSTDSQQACFTNYDSTGTIFQNNICIDSGYKTDSDGGNMYGGFWDERNNDTDKTGTVVGNIVLNVRTNYAGMLDKLSGTRTLSNNVIWDSGGGYGTLNYTTSYPPHARLSNMTIGSLVTTPSDLYACSGAGVCSNADRDVQVTNSIIYGSPVGVKGYVASTYNSIYGNTANFSSPATAGTGDITNTNPLTNCLKYLPRIEAGCSLKTAGSGGGQIGAQILYKYGVDGTLHGETGYDTLTTEPLWPFPNEALIKSDMAAYSGPGYTGARGFATGTSRDGSPQTLTKYIWEYLGHQIPADIYSGSTPPSPPTVPPPTVPLPPPPVSDSTVPVVTAFSLPSTANSTSISITTYTISDETALASSPFCITTVNTSSGCSWGASKPTTVTGSLGSNTFYAWARDSAGNISTAVSATVTVTPPTGNTYYVRPDGSDTASGVNNTTGTSGAWLTLQKAANTVVAGDTVLVADGTYAGFYVEKSGTSSKPITFKALGAGANITSRNTRTTDNINIESWTATPTDYITIDGFNVYNSTRVGVRAIAGTGIIIQNNTIRNNTSNGILSGNTPSIQVLNNKVFSNGATNQQHNVYISNAGSDGAIVRGNTIYSSNYGNGLQLNGDYKSGGDGYIDNFLIENNTIHSNVGKGMSLISVRYGTVRNNITYGNGGAGGIHLVQETGGTDLTYYSTGNTVVNNTLDESAVACVRINALNTNNAVFNNICIGSKGIVFEGTGNYQNNNISTTSGFINYVGHDYRLVADSPAVDTGISVYGSTIPPSFDILGTARPQNNLFDIGAYEYLLPSGAPPKAPTGVMKVN